MKNNKYFHPLCDDSSPFLCFQAAKKTQRALTHVGTLCKYTSAAVQSVHSFSATTFKNKIPYSKSSSIAFLSANIKDSRFIRK